MKNLFAIFLVLIALPTFSMDGMHGSARRGKKEISKPAQEIEFRDRVIAFFASNDAKGLRRFFNKIPKVKLENKFKLDSQKRLPLLYVALTRNLDFEIYEILLSFGADPNSVCGAGVKSILDGKASYIYPGSNAAHFAVHLKGKKVLRLLERYKTNFLKEDVKKRIPLDIARDRRDGVRGFKDYKVVKAIDYDQRVARILRETSAQMMSRDEIDEVSDQENYIQPDDDVKPDQENSDDDRVARAAICCERMNAINEMLAFGGLCALCYFGYSVW